MDRFASADRYNPITNTELVGIYMSRKVNEFATTVTNPIDRNSRKDDPMFIFSYQPLYYVLSKRQPPTFGLVHWFDVAPNALCRADAQRLVEDKPRSLLTFHERRLFSLP